MFDPLRYTIGWVCAIPPELVAAKLHLDVEHDHTEYEAAPNDNNTYVFGQIGRHNVVIATLPRGEYGISSAAGVARDLVRSFTNVRIGLMVGIGGGAPLVEQDENKPQDIRLGDVVVSVPANGRGGVCQYDYGKAIQGQGFLLTGHLDSPPSSLLTAVTVLGAEFDIEGHCIEDEIDALLANRRRLVKAYRRPDAATDLLRRASVAHSDADWKCSVACSRDEDIVVRAPREEENVMVHYGLVASANMLMKDAHLRDAIARKHGVLCYEMEAAGLMNHFPFLVIRGICDYSDSHKSKEWQGYAAMTAAGYTKKLLLRLAPGKVEAEVKLSELEDIKEGVQQIAHTVTLIENQIDRQSTRALRGDIDRWLAAPDPSTNHNNALKLRFGGTGSWVFESTTFSEWQQDKFSVAWFHGIPGCGKTVLASTMIEHLRGVQGPSEPVLYFYFDVQDERKQGLDNVMRALIRQLYHAQDTSPDHLEQLYDSCQKASSSPSTPQLRSCFADMCNGRPITVVLDAIDECTTAGRKEVLAWIRDTALSGKTRLIVTSRTLHEITAALTAWLPRDASLEIQGDSLNEDIRSLVQSEIFDDAGRLSRWRSNAEIQYEIETNLMEKAQGMFRWVVCQLETLELCLKPRSLKAALASLPIGLDETYNRILQQISRIHLSDAVRLLQFLVFSERPLTLEEAVDALAVDPLSDGPFDVSDRMPIPGEIAKLCASLTRVTSRRTFDAYGRELGTVTEIQLAHASVKEYLLSERPEGIFRRDFQEQRAKASIVQVSLAYLYQASQLPHSDLPFSAYAARYWIEYARVAEREGESVLDWIHKLLTSEGPRRYWLRIHNPDDEPSWVEAKHPPDALYLASLRGLIGCVKRLIHEGVDVNASRGRIGSVLLAAVKRGHLDVVRLLLDDGADVNARGDHHVSALYAASENGFLDMTKLLLDAGADVNAQCGSHDFALYAALANGHRELVELLLDRGADAYRRHRFSNSALHAASVEGDINTVKLLLAKGIDVNCQGGHFGNALQAASFKNYREVVELLLDKGADVNTHGGEYATALQAASDGPFPDLVRLLLDKGADVNIQGGRYGNALQAASAQGSLESVRLLLDKGADPRAHGGLNYSALQAASSLGHLEIVKLLIDSGAQVNGDRGGTFGNPLCAAVAGGYLELAQLLLDNGADVNDSAGDAWGSALYQAAGRWSLDMVKLLLERGADVNAEGGYFGNAFYHAQYEGSTAVMDLLLDAGYKAP